MIERRGWMKQAGRGVALGLLGAILAACAGAPPPPSPAAAASATGQDGAVAALPTLSSGLRRIVKLHEIENRPPPVIRALLGPPGLERREPPAEVWQYVSATCILDITFYPAADAQPLRAAYLESRATTDGTAMASTDCLPHVGIGATPP